jgi:acyl-CoA hydrolase
LRPLYDFIGDNPLVEVHPCDFTNDPFVIGQNANMVAVNSALQIDLTGQVDADSVGTGGPPGHCNSQHRNARNDQPDRSGPRTGSRRRHQPR